MKRVLAAILLAAAASRGAFTQEQPPNLLVQAAQCLAAKHFLPRSNATDLSFGYWLDVKSYPGEKMLYVVDYTGSDRAERAVFTIFLRRKERQRVFNVQNDATFVMSKGGVRFIEEPLWGIWTRQHLVSAIKQIERQPRFTVPVSKILVPSPLIRCESYAELK